MLAPFLILLVITTLFIGFEAAFYLGIGLFGLAFWLYGGNPIFRMVGSIFTTMGMVLFLITFTYYYVTLQFFPSNPFKFRFLGQVAETVGMGWRWSAYKLGEIILSYARPVNSTALARS